MASCVLCKAEIPVVFLEKIKGTFVRDKAGKRKAVCASCQRTNAKKDIRALV